MVTTSLLQISQMIGRLVARFELLSDRSNRRCVCHNGRRAPLLSETMASQRASWIRVNSQVRVQDDLLQQRGACEDRRRPKLTVANGSCGASVTHRKYASSARVAEAGRKSYPRQLCRRAAGLVKSQSVTYTTQIVACTNIHIVNGLVQRDIMRDGALGACGNKLEKLLIWRARCRGLRVSLAALHRRLACPALTSLP